MTEYKKVGTKKIEGKAKKINVYKKTGSNKLYVMYKTAKGKVISYTNYKKMCAKKLTQKKVVKRKVVKRKVVKRGGQGYGYNMDGGNVQYKTKWGVSGGEDVVMTGKDLGLSLPNMAKLEDEMMGGKKNKKRGGTGCGNNDMDGGKSLKKKGGTGCGNNDMDGGKGLKKRINKYKKGGDSDSDYNYIEEIKNMLGGKTKLKLKGGNDIIADEISINDLKVLQDGGFDISGGAKKRSGTKRSKKTLKKGGELDELLGGAKKRSRTY